MRILQTLVAAGLVALAGAAYAQQASPGIDDLVEMLDAPAFADRDAARTALVQHPSLSDDRIIELLEADDTSPEQSLALRTILFDRFVTRGVGAVGVTFSQTSNESGLVIENVSPNFPAVQQGLIKPNDIIAEVDGVDLTEILHGSDPRLRAGDKNVVRTPLAAQAQTRTLATRTVQSLVFSRHPGESLPMVILRANEAGVLERIETEIPLGDYQSHERPGSTNAVIHDAYRLRLQRVAGLELPDVATVPQTADYWPMPSTNPTPRMLRNPVVGGPTTLTTKFNPLDPYYPRRAQDSIRREFTQYNNILDAQEAKGPGKVPEPAVQQARNQMLLQRRVAAQNVKRAQPAAGQQTGLHARGLTVANLAEPVVVEMSRLRAELSSLGRRLAEATDEATRTRLRERVDETADAIEALSGELEDRVGTFDERPRTR